MVNYDALAAEYARNRKLHPEVLRRLLARAEGPILEVGCGPGNYIHALAEATPAFCQGTDPSEGMLEAARRRAGKVAFAPGRAEQLEFPGASFGLVFSVDVIHHVGDRPAYFAEARRVLRSGGRCCTVTDSEWIIRQRVPLSRYFPETVEAELRRYPSIPTLRVEMEQAGFGEVTEEMVEFSYLLEDAAAYRAKTFSSLHLIGEQDFALGLARLEADLRAGPIPCVSRYTMLWGVSPLR